MRIAYITAGAAGMYCGSCLRDNTLVAALRALGHDAILVPTYTPIRTDEHDVSLKRVFLGGLNVYLQQKLALFRHTPWLLDRLLDSPSLLRWVSRFAGGTEASELGDLAVSMLKGEHGNQRKEIAKLVRWLSGETRPDVINLTNVLLSGLVHELKERVRVPVVATLQGDDIFVESLPQLHRTEALALIREHCRHVDGFIATSAYYADFMAGYLAIPRDRIHVVHPGLNLTGHGGLAAPTVEAAAGVPRAAEMYSKGANGAPFTIGYFARICPEKGLHLLVDAYRLLREALGPIPCRLRVSGWLGQNQRAYLDEQRRRLRQWKFDDQFDYVESPDHAAKVRFLRSLDVLSVPTIYREPKGLYILEAWANGIPVVQPAHGAFPELIESSGGGLLAQPNDPQDLARALKQLLDNAPQRLEMGRRGWETVAAHFHAAAMAARTVEVYRQYLSAEPQPSVRSTSRGAERAPA